MIKLDSALSKSFCLEKRSDQNIQLRSRRALPIKKLIFQVLTYLFTNKVSCLFTLGDDEAAIEGLLGGAETELDTEW